MDVTFILRLVGLLLVLLAVFFAKKLTVAGTLVAGLVACVVFTAFGWTGILILGGFFLMATIATSWKRTVKAELGLRDAEGSRRDAWQVLANGGLPALIAAGAVFYPQYQEFLLTAFAGAFSAATADTVSSELGNVYGSRYFNILSFKAERRGLDGVVSLEGTFFGLAGSLVIALLAQGHFLHYTSLLIVTCAGLLGNIADSIAGATLERQGWLKNNSVNLLNTTVGALTAIVLTLILE